MSHPFDPRAWPIASTLGLLATAPAAAGAPCTDYGAFARWIGGTALDDLPSIVTPGNDFVFVADGDSGMQIVDVTPPDQAHVVATVSGAGTARAVDRIGDLAVLAGESKIQIVNVSLPESPSVVATLLPGEAGHFARFDPRTDVLGPSTGNPQVLYVSVSRAVVDRDSVEAWDLRAPTTPVRLGGVKLERPGEDLNWVEQQVGPTKRSYLYAPMFDLGLRIVDVTDPAAPTSATYSPLMSICRGATARAGVAYLAMAFDGMEIVDVSDPTSPSHLGFFFPAGDMLDVTLLGDDLLVVSTAGLHLYDLTNPVAPALLRTYELAFPPVDAQVAGDRIYATDVRNLHILDVAARDPLPATATVPLTGTAHRIVRQGSHAYVAAQAGGLHVLDVSDPAAPSLAGTLPPPADEFLDVVVSGDHAFVAGGTGGFHVIDVSVPAAPTLLSTTPMGGNGASAVALAGTLAYVVEHGVGVRILDVAVPAAPAAVATFPLTENARGIAVHGGALYVATTSALHAVDVSKPASPVAAGLDPRYFEAIEVDGDLAYAVGGEYQAPSFREIVVLDLGVPLAPVQIGRAEAGVSGLRLEPQGDLVWVACDRMGLHAIDVSDPSDPRNVGGVLPDAFLGAGQTTRDVSLVEGWVYTAEGASGVRVYRPPCPPTAVAATVASTPEALRVRAHPNPFHTGTSARFELARGGAFTLTVHDVRGRLVRSLGTGRLPAGAHVFHWDGRDAGGTGVAAGVYFLRLRAAGRTAVAKAVLRR